MSKRSKELRSSNRNTDTRTENTKKNSDGFISFSFKHFSNIDGIGQSIQTWQSEALTDSLYEKLIYVTQNGITILQQEGTLTCYKRFPSVSDFSVPGDLDESLNWSVIKNIGGQKHRVAGFIENNVFYIVYLDRDHRFWPTSR